MPLFCSASILLRTYFAAQLFNCLSTYFSAHLFSCALIYFSTYFFYPTVPLLSCALTLLCVFAFILSHLFCCTFILSRIYFLFFLLRIYFIFILRRIYFVIIYFAARLCCRALTTLCHYPAFHLPCCVPLHTCPAVPLFAFILSHLFCSAFILRRIYFEFILLRISFAAHLFHEHLFC